MAAVLLGAALGAAGDASAVCGDALIDPGEQCDDGDANGTDGCCSSACELLDVDADGTCDELDSCDDRANGGIEDARLKLIGLATPPGDDRLQLSGTLAVPGSLPVDPSASGFRLTVVSRLTDPRNSTLLDARVPGGAGWRRTPMGAAWRYRDPAGAAGGVTEIMLRMLPSMEPRSDLTRLAFKLAARRGNYGTAAGDMAAGSPLRVTVALASSASALEQQCGHMTYLTGLPGECRSSAAGDRMVCRRSQGPGPCSVEDPEERAVCDAVSVGAGQAAYWAANGFYMNGSCSALPGFVSSPGVICTTVGTSGTFVAATTYVGTGFTCVSDRSYRPVDQTLVIEQTLVCN